MGSKYFLVLQNFGPKKTVDQKIFFGPKKRNFWSITIFGPKKNLVKYIFGLKEFRSKNCCYEKIFGPKKNCGPKKIVGSKNNFGQKIFLGSNINPIPQDVSK